MKRVVAVHSLVEHAHSRSFRTVSARSGGELDLDPFLNVDLFHMSQPTFPPHPHAGFSAVTYMLPESEGGFVNRDSFGDHSAIEPGAIHWTQAGRGMMHEEVPARAGVDCWGFQIFVDLAAADELGAPRAFHAAPYHVPLVELEGARVRVAAGTFGPVRSPLDALATSVDLFDVRVLPVAEGRRAWAFELDAVGGAHRLVRFSDEGADVKLHADGRELRALVGAGVPLRQPRVWSGPFCLTTTERIAEARRAYQRGDMGRLTPSF
jgi:redox-sensitive bicupin YhaK (pirin superfamily)